MAEKYITLNQFKKLALRVQKLLYDALTSDQPIYFGCCDSDNNALLDSNGDGITGRVMFQTK